MSSNKLLLLICLLPLRLCAQHERMPGQSTLTLYLGGGLSAYQGRAGTPSGLEAPTKTRHPIGTFRLLWHPDHLLRVGLESGWLRFYSYTINDNGVRSSTEVRATPILVVFSMPVGGHLKLYSGSGSFIVHSILKDNDKVRSSAHSLGWMLGAGYEWKLSGRKWLSLEGKWLRSSTSKDGSLSIQALLRWDVLNWQNNRRL